MTASTKPATDTPRPRGLALLGVALRSRKAGCMLGLGFSSGLPFALLIGTLNVWLVEAGIKLATIGVLSWIGLSYSFKFLWAPLVDRMPLPVLEALGRRKSWIVLCQCVLVAGFASLAAIDPRANIGLFASIAFAAAFASATQDIAIDAWRIDVADEHTSVDLLSAVSQFGYRIAAICGGALALFMAARMSWPHVFGAMAGLSNTWDLIKANPCNWISLCGLHPAGARPRGGRNAYFGSPKTNTPAQGGRIANHQRLLSACVLLPTDRRAW